MICSFIEGRVRLRDPRFKNEETAAMLTALLLERPGIIAARANPRTGSLLIEYDPETLDQEEALKALKMIDPEGAAWLEACSAPAGLEEVEETDLEAAPQLPAFLQAAMKGGPRQEAVEYAALSLAFVVCTSSAFLRSKGLHVYSGLTLAGLTLQHVYKYRRRLMRMFGFGPARHVNPDLETDTES